MANILLVEDSPSVRAVVSAALSDLGHKVLEASNGAEGLRIAKSRAVHLVITDLTMPTLDGISLIRALRQTAEHRETPILVFTTTRGRAAEEALRVGANACELKPFQAEQTLATVQRLLGRPVKTH